MTGSWWSKDTVAVVTGGNRGIGYEIVRMLAKDGVTVVLTARDPTKGQAAADAVTAEGFGSVVFHPLETGSAESAEKLAVWLKSEFGGIDILINNAGVAVAGDLGYEAAKQIIDVNYYGTRNVTEKLLPLFKATPAGGRIVNLTSRMGVYGSLPGESLKQKFADPTKYSTEFVDSMVSQYLEDMKAGTVAEDGWIVKDTDLPMYSESKIFLGAWSVALAKSLANSHPDEKQIFLMIMCPGATLTDMLHGAQDAGFVIPEGFVVKTVEEGAETAEWLAMLPKADLLAKSGKFFGERREWSFENRGYVDA